MKKPVRRYKEEFDNLNKLFQEKKDLHEAELKKKDDYIKDMKDAFTKALNDMAPLYMHDSFSEGHLAPDLKYTLKVSRMFTSDELELLIKKLQFDKAVIQTKGRDNG